MKIQQTLINFPYDFPLKVTIEKIASEERDWHKTLKILYVLEGECDYIVDTKIIHCVTNDIFIINPYTIYEIKCKKNVVFLSFDVNLSQFGFSLDEIDKLYFLCNSALESDKSKFHTLRETIFGIIRANVTIKENIGVLNQALSYQLLYLLLGHYKVKGETVKRSSQKNLEKIKDIINYIEQHYKENITLNDLSIYFGYTPQYFSSFFTQNLNQKFQNYYDTLRVNKSLENLANSDLPLEEIAIEAGFADYRSYIRAFKNIFNQTPSEFKKKNNDKKKKETNFYIDFDKKHYLDIIFSRDKEESLLISSPTLNEFQEINCNYLEKGETIKKTFKELLYVSRASLILTTEIQDILRKVQKEIGFKYIRFHGLLSDDMHLFRINRKNQVSYSYVFLDKLFDFLKEINIKPFITLDFMPYALAENKQNTIYSSRYIISKPNDYELYKDLLINLFNHLIERYGLNEVITWPVTLWNEPDSTSHAFGFNNDSDFFKLYEVTYNTIKEIDKSIQVGSPSLIPFASFARKWDLDFLKYAKFHQVYPDFLALHYYSNDFDFFINNMNVEKLNKDPDALHKYITSISDINFYHGKKIYLVEWNVTSSQRNYINDTIFSSCYLVKNIVENMDRLNSFARASLSDFSDETQLPETTFHGGNGMFTYNSIPKASYHALRLLNKLGDQVIAKGDNYYITKTRNKLQILLYNYEHFIDLFADGEYFSIKYHHRYHPFKMNSVAKVNIKINNLSYSSAKIKTTSINQESGSAYDILESMSKLELDNNEDIETIKALSIPKFNIYEEEIINNTLEINLDLLVLEVKLIEIDLYK